MASDTALKACSPDHITRAGGENSPSIQIEDNQDADCFSIRYTDPQNGGQDLIHFCDWPALKAAIDKHQAERGGQTEQQAWCGGKGFEHHQRVIALEPGGPWSCPDCGDTGSYADFAAHGKRLMRLMPLYEQLQEQMLHEHAVILVPTEAATGSLGTFLGRDVLRVPGLKEPMIGVRALPFAVDWASVNAELERENGPVAGAERQDVRTEWLGR